MAKGTKARIVLLAAIGILAVGMITGILVAAGMFRSDKVEAMQLFVQAPERLFRSSVREYVGAGEMADNFLHKGGMADIKMSDMQIDTTLLKKYLLGEEAGQGAAATVPGLLLRGVDWQDFALEWNMRYHMASGRTSNAVILSREEEEISLIQCQDEDEKWFALPELLEGKVFHTTKEEWKEIQEQHGGISMMAKVEGKDVMAFCSDFAAYLTGSAGEIQKNISCEKMRKAEAASWGDTGYILVIPKDTVNSLLGDLADILDEQEKETFHVAGQRVAAWTVSQDIEWKVFGRDGNLCRIEGDVPVQGERYHVTMDFEGKEGDSTATVEIRGNAGEEEGVLTIQLSDKKGEKCKTTTDIQFLMGDKRVAHAAFHEEVTPDSGAYRMGGSLALLEQEVCAVSAEGSIKDLEQGTGASYILDDVKIMLGGSEVAELAADVRVASREGNLEPPKGQMVEITSDTTEEEMEPYTLELRGKLKNKLSKMGLPGTLLMEGLL